MEMHERINSFLSKWVLRFIIINVLLILIANIGFYLIQKNVYRKYVACIENMKKAEYFSEVYPKLKQKNITLSYYDNENKTFSEVKNTGELNNALQGIVNRNREERFNEHEEGKEDKYKVIGNTFGLKGYNENPFIFIPEKYEKEMLKNRNNKFYYQSTRCKLMNSLMKLK